jgi:Zn-dependent protease with chaperone function
LSARQPLRVAGARHPSVEAGNTGNPIVTRALARLAASLSGQLLASRPQRLMAQVLRRDSTPREQAGYATVQALHQESRRIQPAAPFALQRRAPSLENIHVASAPASVAWQSVSRDLLPISAADFVLPARLRLQVYRQDAEMEAADRSNLAQGEEARPMARREAAPPQPATEHVQRPSSQRSTQRQTGRQRSEPIRPQTALVQLQVAAPRPLPNLPASAPVLRSAQPSLQRSPQRRRLVEMAAPALGVFPVRPSAPAAPARPGGPLQQPQAVSTAVALGSTVRPLSLPSVPGAGVPGPFQRLAEQELAPASTAPFDLAIADEPIAQRVVRAISPGLVAHARAASGETRVTRAFANLSNSLSGQMLASRPQQLMAQVMLRGSHRQPARRGIEPATERHTATLPAAMTPAAIQATGDLESFSFAPYATSWPAPQPQLLPISVDDFVLPLSRRRDPRHVEQVTVDSSDDLASRAAAAVGSDTQGAHPHTAAASPSRPAPARIQPPVVDRGTRSTASRREQGSRSLAVTMPKSPATRLRAVHPQTALVQLQAAMDTPGSTPVTVRRPLDLPALNLPGRTLAQQTPLPQARRMDTETDALGDAMGEAVAQLAATAQGARRFQPASQSWRPPQHRRRSQPRSGETALSTPGRRLPRNAATGSTPPPEATAPTLQEFQPESAESLLKPGSLVLETLSNTEFIQRARDAAESRQDELPLAELLLGRAQHRRQMRASQPPLPALPVEIAAVRREVTPPPEPALRAERAPRAVQRRVRPTTLPVPAQPGPRQRQEAVAELATRQGRTAAFEPVSALWRGEMLPGAQPPIAPEVQDAPRAGRLLQRQDAGGRRHPAAELAEILLPRGFAIETLSQSSLVQAMQQQPSGQGAAAMPLHALSPAVSRPGSLQARLRPVAPAAVAAAVAGLDAVQRSERRVQLRVQRSPARQQIGQPSRSETPPESAPLAARFVRPSSAATASSRPTLLERVVARDFADLRREQVDAGILVLPPSRPAPARIQPPVVDRGTRSTASQREQGSRSLTAVTIPKSPATRLRAVHPQTALVQLQAAMDTPGSTPVTVRRPLELPTLNLSGQALSQPIFLPQARRMGKEADAPVDAMGEAVAQLAATAQGARRFQPASQSWRPPQHRRRSQPRSGETALPTPGRRLPRNAATGSTPAPETTAATLQEFQPESAESLLKPGSLVLETLSNTEFIQRARDAAGSRQDELPLAELLLGRAQQRRQMRTSQPPLPALPAELAAVRREVTPPPPEPARRAARAPRAVQRRVRPTSQPAPAQPAPRQRQEAVAELATRQARTAAFEPVSALWRGEMLPGAQPSIAPEVQDAPRTGRLLQRQDAGRRRHPAAELAEILLPRGFAIETLSQSSLVQAMQQQPSGQGAAAMPLHALSPDASRPGSEPARLRPVAPAAVAAAVAGLDAVQRSERRVQLRVQRSPARQQIGQPSRSERSPESVPLAARFVRPSSAATASSRRTLLERVVARDFADLRREQVDAGILVLPPFRERGRPGSHLGSGQSAHLSRISAGLELPSTLAASPGRPAPTAPSQQPSAPANLPNLPLPLAAASLSRSPQPVGVQTGAAAQDPQHRRPSLAEPLVSLRQLSRELHYRSGLVRHVRLADGGPMRLDPAGSDFSPVSGLWRQSLLRDEKVTPLMAEQWPGADGPAPRLQPTPRGEASVLPLTLAMQRLLGIQHSGDETAGAGAVAESLLSPAQPAPARPGPGLPAAHGSASQPAVTAQPLPTAPLVDRMEQRGWRFKRAGRVVVSDVAQVQRSVETLGQRRSQRLPEPVRTLMERVLGRDFAGVRVQMASLGALGVEAAARESTIYLSPEAMRLDRPQLLGLLAHELTHVAARGGRRTQRMASSDPLPLAARGRSAQGGGEPGVMPAPQTQAVERSMAVADLHQRRSPLRPHLTRQLSQRLVQMSLAQEERTAEEVEVAVARLALSAHVARSFRPASQIWQPEPLPHGSTLPPSPDLAELSMGTLQRAPSGELSLSAARPFSAELPVAAATRAAQSAPALPALPALPASPVAPGGVVSRLESQGWRFKRAERVQLAPPDRIQRAVQHLQQSADRGMPLPRQPRTLMEQVLQRDFSRVRVQTAPLASLGVEAAARGNTVFLAREQASQMERPENLALLGHELTHVAASGHAPAQRPAQTARAEMPVLQRSVDGSQPLQRNPDLPAAPPRPLLAPTIQRSLAAEEATAERVEQGLRTFLRQSTSESGTESSALQQSPAAVMPVAQGGARAVISSGASRRASTTAPRVQRVSARPAEEKWSPLSVSPGHLRALRQGESTLSGVPAAAMNLAPKTPVVQRTPTDSGNSPVTVANPMIRRGEEQISRTVAEPLIQRADGDSDSTANLPAPPGPVPIPTQDNDHMDLDRDLTDDEVARLAEKVYPLIKRILRLERERLPR